jgi:hypothetical protein
MPNALDPAVFSGHSLRAGFPTSAAGKGASIFKMMDVSPHKSVDTLRGFVRDAELFKDHAGTGLPQSGLCADAALARCSVTSLTSNRANRTFARATMPGHFARTGPVPENFALP